MLLDSKQVTIRAKNAIALACAIFAMFAAGGVPRAQEKPEGRAPATLSLELASVPGGRVVTVTPVAGYQNEPSVAVNRRNPQQVIVGFQIGPKVAFTRDGGINWTLASGTTNPDYRISADVSVAYDNHGNAIMCHIAFDHLGTENYWASGATRNGIYVRRSSDGGATWEAQEHAVIAQPTQPNIPFEDKPYIVADDTDGRYAGNLYVGWTEFRVQESVILFSRSTDGGNSWSVPVDVSNHHGLPRDDNGAVEGFTGAIGADGALYAAWADGNTIAFTTSHDGGKTFSRSRSIIETAPLFFPASGLDRASGFPQIAIDPRKGRDGRLYVTWSDYRNGDVNVFSASSDNRGRSWTRPVRVNSNPMHDGTDQFFQWLAVDSATGTVNVIFYDRRFDPKNAQTTVTLARSVDGGRTFTNYSWTHEPFIPRSEEFLGDYIGLAALNGKVYGAWAELPPPGAPQKQTDSPTTFQPHTILRVGVANFGTNKSEAHLQ